MPKQNLLYAQSGGVTAVINASAHGVISAARARRDAIGKVFAARNGILGVLREELFDLTRIPARDLQALAHTPGGAFGSCRFKLGTPEDQGAHYQRIFEVLDAHRIGMLLYNGGNDSADTALKLSRAAKQVGYPLTCVAVPKTVDNDLAVIDHCPGFPSVAKYVAVSTQEASLDVAAMAESSTKVFVLEVMGRHAGWIAAAAGLADTPECPIPLLILFPERPFDDADFLRKVQAQVSEHGFCTVVVSEGLRNAEGAFVAEAGGKDAFGHSQLGGAGPFIAALVKDSLGFKVHHAIADYLQRSARHLASMVDYEEAIELGRAAVGLAVDGVDGHMPVIKRISDRPYRTRIEAAPLSRIANHEKKLPARYIRADGYGITAAARRYLAPLIVGEAPLPWADGLPGYRRLSFPLLAARLPAYSVADR